MEGEKQKGARQCLEVSWEIEINTYSRLLVLRYGPWTTWGCVRKTGCQDPPQTCWIRNARMGPNSLF